MHKRSRYADASMSDARCRNAWRTAIGEPSMPVFVSEEGDEINGAIVGHAAQVMQSLDVFLVNDYLWYVKPGTPASVAGGLLEALEQWAEASFGDKAIVRITVHDAVVDPDLAAGYLRKKGFVETGFTLEKRGMQ